MVMTAETRVFMAAIPRGTRSRAPPDMLSPGTNWLAIHIMKPLRIRAPTPKVKTRNLKV